MTDTATLWKAINAIAKPGCVACPEGRSDAAALGILRRPRSTRLFDTADHGRYLVKHIPGAS